MPDELHLIVNPDRDGALDPIEDRAHQVERPGTPADLRGAAERVADADVVAAVGGDGTQRTVAEVLAGQDASLLVIPAGTVNLLGRLHGIETVDDAQRALDDGEDRRLDLGRCNGEPFVLNASTGYDAEVIASLDDRVKRWGRLGIGAMGAARLVPARRRTCRVRANGTDVFVGRALTVLVMNVAYRGSTSRALVPEAAGDDGLLHVLVFPDRSAVVRTIWSLVRGRRRPGDVVTASAGRIDVDWSVPVPSQRDGDADGEGSSYRYDVEPGAVTLRVPSGD